MERNIIEFKDYRRQSIKCETQVSFKNEEDNLHEG